MFEVGCMGNGFGYDRKTCRAFETIRAVAAVSFSFHRTFGAIRCAGNCKATRTLGDFDYDASCNVSRACYTCINPSAPFVPIVRSDNGEKVYADNRYFELDDFNITEWQVPSASCASHPTCGFCRSEEEQEQDRLGWVSDNDDCWSNSS
jgi:hypothetical protein